jgi:cytochrome oxidase Cu insertion factor (SCO1/SenC/PrrC family)
MTGRHLRIRQRPIGGAYCGPGCLGTVRFDPSRDAYSPIVSEAQPLPKIAPAPDIALTSQDGAQVSLAKLRGKVVAVTFIFTRCSATCLVLTPMM